MSESEPVMYIVARTDLGLSPGKLAAQVGHAVGLAMRRAEQMSVRWLSAWEAGSYAKVVLGVISHQELSELAARLHMANIGFRIVEDEGRTETEPGTRTCLGIVPMPKEMLKPYVGQLKLYR